MLLEVDRLVADGTSVKGVTLNREDEETISEAEAFAAVPISQGVAVRSN